MKPVAKEFRKIEEEVHAEERKLPRGVPNLVYQGVTRRLDATLPDFWLHFSILRELNGW